MNEDLNGEFCFYLDLKFLIFSMNLLELMVMNRDDFLIDPIVLNSEID